MNELTRQIKYSTTQLVSYYILGEATLTLPPELHPNNLLCSEIAVSSFHFIHQQYMLHYSCIHCTLLELYMWYTAKLQTRLNAWAPLLNTSNMSGLSFLFPCFLVHMENSAVLLATQSTTQHKYTINTHTKHSQHSVGLLPAHSKAKGFMCDMQRVLDRAGWGTREALDMLMGDLKPLLLGIKDLRKRKRAFSQCEHGLLSCVHVSTIFVPSFLFYIVFWLKTAFEIN